MDCEQIRELIEAYALGVLDPEQQELVEGHLAACPECTALVQESVETAASLPGALTVASPHRLPDDLKARIIRQIEMDEVETRPIAGTVSSLERVVGAPSPNRPLVRPDPEVDDHMASRSDPHSVLERSTRVHGLRLGLAIASLIVTVLLVWSIRLNVVLARERALRAEFAELVDRQELVLEVIDSNETVRRVLRPPEGDSRAYGKVFTRTGLPYVVAMAARLPNPAAGEAYHLWLVEDGQTELAGLLNVNDEGFGLIVHEAEQADLMYDEARVTLQATDSNVPEDPPILIWQADD